MFFFAFSWLIYKIVDIVRHRSVQHSAVVASGIVTNVLVIISVLSAFPWVRNYHHNVFERHHRFIGWLGLAVRCFDGRKKNSNFADQVLDNMDVCHHGKCLRHQVGRMASRCSLFAECARVLVCRIHDYLVSEISPTHPYRD